LFKRLVNTTTVSIVDDGVIIDPRWAEGRPIPAIIVDARERADIVEYIEAHRTQPPGDVTVQWGTALTSKKKVSLILKSARPVLTEFAIEFDVNKHHSLIDGILQTNGFYLLTGKSGDKVRRSQPFNATLFGMPRKVFPSLTSFAACHLTYPGLF